MDYELNVIRRILGIVHVYMIYNDRESRIIITIEFDWTRLLCDRIYSFEIIILVGDETNVPLDRVLMYTMTPCNVLIRYLELTYLLSLIHCQIMLRTTGLRTHHRNQYENWHRIALILFNKENYFLFGVKFCTSSSLWSLWMLNIICQFSHILKATHDLLILLGKLSVCVRFTQKLFIYIIVWWMKWSAVTRQTTCDVAIDS